MTAPTTAWPDGKQFAFTIVDDTDAATVDNVRPVYDLLADLGLRTTKTVWPLASRPGTPLAGDTLEDPAHRAWIHQLQRAGFEIGYHGAAAEPSPRERSRLALDRFRAELGHDPRIYASHSGQTEAMYWGPARMGRAAGLAFALANRALGRDLAFEGEAARSPYFWGDLCRDRIDYVRNFTFADINTLRCDPAMPYHDPRKPYVRWWFSSTSAPVARDFRAQLCEANQDRLVAERGACIIYTHFAAGFVDGRLDPEVARLLTRLAGLPGWFVPASELLDHLRTRPGWTGQRTQPSLAALELRWIRDNLRGSRGRKYWQRLVRTVRGPVS